MKQQTINFVEAIKKNNQNNTCFSSSLQPLWKNTFRLQDIEKQQQYFKNAKECVPFPRDPSPRQMPNTPQSKPSNVQPQKPQSIEQKRANDLEKSEMFQFIKDMQKHSPKAPSFF